MSEKLKLFIIGATGYIGRYLIQHSKENFKVFGTAPRNKAGSLVLDLAHPLNFDYNKLNKGDTIFLTAAISSPDTCANEFDWAWSVNVIGTNEFIMEATLRGARVVFFSSDTVYGETPNKFDETQACNPSGEYALMKYEIEQRFVNNPSFKSIRLSYVFSHEDKFTKYLTQCVKQKKVANLFHPFFRAIIHRDDVIDGALALAQNWDEFPQQIINFGGPELLSRVDFAEHLKRMCLPQLNCQVTQPGEQFFKHRPRTIAMKSKILPKLLGRPSHSLEEAVLIEYTKNKEFFKGT